MSENKKIGSRSAPFVRTDNNGMFQSSGPFIGVIKNNIDPTCAGRLQVFLSHHGGPDENDPGNWVTVNYASPFRGQTRQRTDLNWYIDYAIDPTTTDGAIQENSFQSYGFWFVPPDLNGRVLCFFANGDPSQGYWTSCIQDSMDSHMVPGIGAVNAATSSNPGAGGYLWRPTGANALPTHTMLQSYIQITGNGQQEIPYRLPVSEPVLINQNQSNPSTPSQVVMVPQVYQTLQLGLQGLAFDFIRGSTSASSVRENPSQVFGISTPGRLTSFANVALSQNILSRLNALVNSGGTQGSTEGTSLEKAISCAYRTGGHQFVMDDGSIDGQDQGIRIRTTGGNEILMDDTNGQIYIINGPGTAWIELSPSGFIDVFASNDFSIRTHGNINMHADKNISINAGGNFEVHADQNIQLDGLGTYTARSTGGATIYDTASMNIGVGGPLLVSSTKADFNTGSEFHVQAADISLPGPATIVKDPGVLQLNKQIEVAKQTGTNAWWQTGTFKTIAVRAPAHEPWPNHEVNGIKTTVIPQGTNIGTAIVRTQTGTTSSGVRGTQKGAAINESQLAQQPITGTIRCLSGTDVLNQSQTQALLAQIGQRESGGNYSQSGNGHGYVGKYQFGVGALQDTGYLYNPIKSKDSSQQETLNNDINWNGGPSGKITSLQSWLASGSDQENAMMIYTQKHFYALQRAGVLTCSSSPAQIGGYLMAAHLVGVGGAILLHNTMPNAAYLNGGSGLSSDANGTTSASYYELGSNAIDLANSVVQA